MIDHPVYTTRMKRIQLSGRVHSDKYLLVDDADYAMAASRKWYWHDGYATSVRHIAGTGRRFRRQRQVVAHRFILGCTFGDGVVVDHKNGNRLDCRRDNLRRTDYRGNARNTAGYAVSGYKGVLQESAACFSAKAAGARLGYYRTAEEAALAVDRHVRVVYGDFAWLNFPEVTDYSAVVALPPRNTGERTSPVVGVSFSRKRKAAAAWRAVYRKVHLGWFTTEEEAIAALKEHKNACR